MVLTQKIKVGVVGVGYLGQHHARIYSELPECELVGIVEIDDQKAKEVCEKFKCRRFNTLEELGRVCDGISVVVPTDKHCEVALSLLKSGAHLLIEKPLCVSLSEASQILNFAKAKNRIVQVGHIEHFNPVMSFLEKAVNNPRYINADRLAPFNLRGTEVGVVLDLMIHDIGIILQLVRSPIKKVDAVGVNVISKTEDIANARIEFENGAVANINASRVSLKKLRDIRVFQPFTYLSLNFMEQKGHLIRMNDGALKQEEIPINKDEPLKLELQSFANCIAQFCEPKVGVSLAKSALEVAIQITEQIQRGLKDSMKNEVSNVSEFTSA